jgi:hypothetical protein
VSDPAAERSTLHLTEISNADGLMRRSVHLTRDGRLIIEGHDLGGTEYEFERSLSVSETARLASLLGVSVVDLLPTIQQRFGTTPPLEAYLEEHGIIGEFWNRIGD